VSEQVRAIGPRTYWAPHLRRSGGRDSMRRSSGGRAAVRRAAPQLFRRVLRPKANFIEAPLYYHTLIYRQVEASMAKPIIESRASIPDTTLGENGHRWCSISFDSTISRAIFGRDWRLT